jgi:hypothetical protein
VAYKPGPRPYSLSFGYPGKKPGEIRWLKRLDFPTPEAAKVYAESRIKREWWIVSAKIVGPDGEVPWPNAPSGTGPSDDPAQRSSAE